MLPVPIDLITIADNRQRREFNPDEIASLMDSIQSKGLFHPIVVRVNNETASIILIAGERRLRAIKDIWALGGSFKYNNELVPEGYIPSVTLGELSPLEIEEAELEENIRRVDLTWQERATANARLAKLRADQAAAKGEEPPTVAAISLEVRGSSEGINQDTTRQEIIVAKHLSNPEVAAAKNVKEAFKILRRQENVKKNLRLAEHVGKTFSADQHKLLLGRFEQWLPDMPDESFDVILTDPPYGMGADEFGDSGGMVTTTHNYKDDYDTWTSIMSFFSMESFRVAKPQAHLYLFCDIDLFPEAKDYLFTAGWTVHRTPIIWHKPNGQRAPWPEHGPQRKYEVILYAMKGKRPTNKLAPDLISYPMDENLGHAAQKPVALYVDLLKRSIRPGDTILDAFCGSGTIFPAAHEVLCTATGIELDPNHYGIAIKRIEGLKK
jgi:DNA modification methylase